MNPPIIALVYGGCFLFAGLCVLGYLGYLAVQRFLRRRSQ